MIVQVVYFCSAMVFGRANFQIAEKVINDDEKMSSCQQFEEESVANFTSWLKWASIVGNLTRVLLLIASIKASSVCKFYLLYDQAVLLIDVGLVQGATAEV